MIYHLALLLLGGLLIEAIPYPTGGKGGGGGGGGDKGGGCKGAGCGDKGGGGGGGGDKGGGGGGCKGGGCGDKGGGGGGKGGGGGGKGGGGGGKKGFYGHVGLHAPILPMADYSAVYGELKQEPMPYDPNQRRRYEPGPLRGYDRSTHRAAYSYNAPNTLYVDYGKVVDYGKGYPVTQGWHGSYDSGWQGTGGPVGYYNPYILGPDDRAALYLRKGMQIGQEGGYRKAEGRTPLRI